MTDTLTLEAPPKPREVRIRELFDELGGAMSMRQFAPELIAAGIYSEDELRSYGLRFIQGEARKALRSRDHVGLPFAGQTAESEDGAPVWKQRSLWDMGAYVVNIEDLITQRDDHHQTALLLASECEDRFGTAPAIASLEGR